VGPLTRLCFSSFALATLKPERHSPVFSHPFLGEKGTVPNAESDSARSRAALGGAKFFFLRSPLPTPVVDASDPPVPLASSSMSSYREALRSSSPSVFLPALRLLPPGGVELPSATGFRTHQLKPSVEDDIRVGFRPAVGAGAVDTPPPPPPSSVDIWAFLTPSEEPSRFSGFRVWGLGCRVLGFVFWILDVGCRV